MIDRLLRACVVAAVAADKGELLVDVVEEEAEVEDATDEVEEEVSSDEVSLPLVEVSAA